MFRSFRPVSKQVGLLAAIILVPIASAQSLSLNISNIPAAATHVQVWIDGGGIDGALSAAQDFARGTPAITIPVTLSPGGPFRLRAMAYDGSAPGNQILRSGKVTGVASSAAQATIALSNLTVTLDPSTPATGFNGGSVNFRFLIADPGDVMEGSFANLCGSTLPVPVLGGCAPFVAAAPVAGSGPGSYIVAIPFNLPALGSAFYYALMISPNNRGMANPPALFSPSPGSPPWVINLVPGPLVQLVIRNIPAQANRVQVILDGSGILGTLVAGQDFPPGTSSLPLSLGVPSPGPFRVRAMTWDNTSMGNPLLRTGKAMAVSTGPNPAEISLSDVSATVDPATPTSAQAGSQVNIRFDIVDSGDIVAGLVATVCGDRAPFSIRAGCPGPGGGGPVTPTAPGLYAVVAAVTLPTQGGIYYYGMILPAPQSPGPPSGPVIYSPDPLVNPVPWTINLVAGPQVQLTVNNVPDRATRLQVLMDGGGLTGALSATQDVPLGTTSTTFLLSLAAGGPYRIRVLAYDASASGNPVLRTGRSTVTVLPTGAVVSLPLSDLAVTLDPATPMSAAYGTQVGIRFNILDPGDVVDGLPAAVCWSQMPFPIRSACPAFGGQAALVPVGPSLYSVTIPLNLPTSGSTLYYAMMMPPIPGTVSNPAGIYSPSPLITAIPWQMALGADCHYSITPGSVSFASPAVTGTIGVSATQGICPWNSHSNASWITLASNTPIAGSGALPYSVAANTTALSRIGSILVGGQVVTVTQSPGPAPCAFTLSPASNLTVTNTGGPSNVEVTATAGCQWAASSNAPWLNITSGASGVGNGTVAYTVAANNNGPRTGTMTIAGQTFTVAQGFTCTYSITPPAVSLGSGAGTTGSSLTGTFTLTASNCTAANTWTAVSDSPRLLITSATSGTGATATTVIGYSMYTNSTTQLRVAHITVAGQIFTVTQAGTTEPQPQRVVRALYQTILGREPDSGGWAFWTGSGAPAGPTGAVLFNQMASDFYKSPEFRDTGFAVLSIYQAVNGQLPSFDQWRDAVNRIRQGRLTPSQLTDTLSGSMSDSVFVQQTHQNACGHVPTAVEAAAWVAGLSNGTYASRFDYLNRVTFQDPDFTSRTNGAFLKAMYFTILLRDPDPDGFTFWTAQLTNAPGMPGIYYIYLTPPEAYAWKLAIIGQAVPPDPNLLGFLGSPEFQGLIQ